MILNPISNGGKGLTPEIIVTAPSGSTLDIMQNSVVLQTYTLGSSETSHTFAVKSVGSYVVRGTSGSQTKSETVSVDSVGQYEVTIALKLYLYNYGDECESVTGGWSANGYSCTGYIGISAEKMSDRFVFTGSRNSGGFVWLGVTNAIDYTSYNKVYIEVKSTSVNRYGGGIFILKSDRNFVNRYSNCYEFSSVTDKVTVSFDIPQLVGDSYILLKVDGANRNMEVYAVWLE